MKHKVRYILMGAVISATLTTQAQISLKATADMGVCDAMRIGSAFQDMHTESSSTDFVIDLGWTFWKYHKSSLEANIGVGYGRINTSAKLDNLEYHYSAPASADMDDEPYIRYYALNNLNQKISTERLTLPIYLNYRYQLSRFFSLNALVGYKHGFNVSSDIKMSEGHSFSYGVYPQYDNLMIDASYMNLFGETVLDRTQTVEPTVNKSTSSVMAGIGAELRFCECLPVSVNFSVKYEHSLNDMYRRGISDVSSFDAGNAPVSYTVAEGQKVMPLSNYFTSSKLSRLSCAISLIYHF